MNTILKLFAFLYAFHMRRLEREVGYKVTFSNIPSTWINGWMTFDIGKSWAKYGIKAQGVDYFTLGSLGQDDISSRFLRSEKQYQSWLGAYLVKFKENREFSIQDHFNLAVADQKNWLGDFGDARPFIKMPVESITSTMPITVGGYEGFLYEFSGGPSQSDVGSKSNNLRNRILMGLMASMFNSCNPKLHLKGKNFIPKQITHEYETVILKGYVAILTLEKNIKVVLYGNGATLLDTTASDGDYYPLLKDDIVTAFRSVIINKLASSR